MAYTRFINSKVNCWELWGCAISICLLFEKWQQQHVLNRSWDRAHKQVHPGTEFPTGNKIAAVLLTLEATASWNLELFPIFKIRPLAPQKNRVRGESWQSGKICMVRIYFAECAKNYSLHWVWSIPPLSLLLRARELLFPQLECICRIKIHWVAW